MTVAEQVRDLLTRLTLGQIARGCGVARSTVLRWTRGAVPRARARARLQMCFGILPETNATKSEAANKMQRADIRTLAQH